MPNREQIDAVVIESFRRIHLEDNEWTFKEDVLERATQIAAAEGLLGETVGYRVGAYVLGLFGREPGPLLQNRRYAPFGSEYLYAALTRLKVSRKVEVRNEPREDRPDRRRIQYSLTYQHPLYGSPAYRER